MPRFDASGDVFTLDGRAGFDEGIIRGEIGGGARLSFTSRFELCHGITAALAADAVAEAQARLGVLWAIAGLGEGEALAAAGVRLDLRLAMDLFDAFGLSATVEAFAEAAVAGRLSIGLDLQDIVRLARSSLSDSAFDVFMAFLREVTIEAGVWGKLAFAAMAKARRRNPGRRHEVESPQQGPRRRDARRSLGRGGRDHGRAGRVQAACAAPARTDTAAPRVTGGLRRHRDPGR